VVTSRRVGGCRARRRDWRELPLDFRQAGTDQTMTANELVIENSHLACGLVVQRLVGIRKPVTILRLCLGAPFRLHEGVCGADAPRLRVKLRILKVIEPAIARQRLLSRQNLASLGVLRCETGPGENTSAGPL
jgi:hypothetical protein